MTEDPIPRVTTEERRMDLQQASPRLLLRWSGIHESFWFVPALMTLAAAVLAFSLVAVDRRLTEDPVPILFTGGADGARDLLSSISTSMITVASLVFSITMVVLTLTSQQYGARVLRNFMGDRGNQIVLGTFVATFLYSILVLRTIRGSDPEFVPNLAVTVAVLLAALSIGVLVYFIHHVSVLMQVSNMVADIGQDLDGAIDRLFPVALGQRQPEDQDEAVVQRDLAPFEHGDALALHARSSGYLQVIEGRALLDLAASHDLVVRLTVRPGQHITRGVVLAEVYAHAGPLTDAALDDLEERLEEVLVIGRQRTPTQDVEYAMDQIVQITLRALSSSYNDAPTANECIDRLGVALVRLAGREEPSPYRHDDHGALRVVAYPLTFAHVLDNAFDQIRQSGINQVAVAMRLFEKIAILGPVVTGERNRAALLRQAEMVRRGYQREVHEEIDLAALEERYTRAVRAVTLHQYQVDRGGRAERHEADGAEEDGPAPERLPGDQTPARATGRV